MDYSYNSNNLTILIGNKNTDQNDWRGFGYKNSDKFVIYGGGTDYQEVNQSIFPIKKNIFEKSKVHCISIHNDTESNPKTNKSSFWANGKLIQNFTSWAITSGANNLILGSESLTNSYIFEGEIFFTSILTERKTKEKEILINHVALCQKFSVGFDEPIINNL